MKYIELRDESGLIVGAEAMESPNYLRYVARHNIFVGCTESQAQGIVSKDGNSIYALGGNELIKSVKDDIVLNAFFVDKDEYDRIDYLLNNSDDTSDTTENTEKTDSESQSQETSEVLTMAQLSAEIIGLKSEISSLKSSPQVNDEATVKFYETLSNSATNSIAKIRQAAQQYLDDTSNIAADTSAETTE